MKQDSTLLLLIQFWRRHQFIFFLIGWSAITFATLTPLDELPIQAPGSDKLHHIIGFAGWTFMVAASKRKHIFYFCLFIFLWGGAIELIQPYVNRHGEWKDFAANTLGIFLAYYSIALIKRMFYRSHFVL